MEKVITYLLLPLIIIFRLLRPIITIRIGMLYTERLGHFARNTDLYLSHRLAGLYPRRTIDFFYCQPFVSNRQLQIMWSRRLHLYDGLIGAFLRRLDIANRKIRGSGRHVISFIRADIDPHGHVARAAPYLSFTENEEAAGRRYLESKGIKNEDKFICFFARDSLYLDAIHPTMTREQLAYHDYRDSSIQNYVPAVEYLAEQRGYHAFRLGALMKDPARSENPKVIDYAMNGDRTEFLDIYLAAKCFFILQGGGSGPAAVAHIFRRPVVPVNLIPLGGCHGGISIPVFIPKKLWLKEEHRFLSFREILTTEIGYFWETQLYERHGIECIENTPEEIKAAAVEADARLRGIRDDTEEEKELQDRFQALFPDKHVPSSGIRSRIGADFLKQNRNLLE